MKKGKKAGLFKLGLIPHKNKDCAVAGVDTTMNEQKKTTCKIKRPEGVYELTFGVVWKSQMKTKGQAKNPLPAESRLDSCVEFTEVRVFADKLIIPEDHTCQVEVSVNLVLNAGKGKDMVPELSLYLDIWTGHWLTGKWHKLLKNVDFSGNRRNKMRIYP